MRCILLFFRYCASLFSICMVGVGESGRVQAQQLRYLDTVFESVFTLNDQIYGLD
jgi:hypothetical protein